jgi:hypothetical protein
VRELLVNLNNYSFFVNDHASPASNLLSDFDHLDPGGLWSRLMAAFGLLAQTSGLLLHLPTGNNVARMLTRCQSTAELWTLQPQFPLPRGTQPCPPAEMR